MQNRIYRSDRASVHRISEIAEVLAMEEGTVQLNKIFQWNGKTDEIENVSISSNTLQSLADIKGIKVTELHNEINRRKLVLDFLAKNNIGVQMALLKSLKIII